MATVLLNGVFVGLVYALLAVGLVIVYRGARVINFAHGETGMVGAFLFVSLHGSGWPLVLALAAAVAVGAGIGLATERLVARPLRDEPTLVLMVGTFAVASLLLVFAARRWGLNPRYVPPLLAGDGVSVAGITVQRGQFLILATTLLVLVALSSVYRYTDFGLRLRATAIDPFAAAQVGVNVNWVAAATWGLAGAIATVSAILIAPLVAFNVYFMTQLTIRSIAAILIGGLTSVWGAAAAGIAIGVVESVIGYVYPGPGLTEVVLTVGIVVLLLTRPAGLVRSAY